MVNFVGIVFDFVGVALDFARVVFNFAMRVVNFTTSVVDSTTLVLVLVLVLVVALAVVLVIGFAVLVIGFVVLVINFAVVDSAVVDFTVVKIRFVDRVKLGVFGVAKGLNPVPDGGKVRMVGSITSFFVSPVIHHGKFKNEKATQIVAKDVRKIEENRAIVLERASENE